MSNLQLICQNGEDKEFAARRAIHIASLLNVPVCLQFHDGSDEPQAWIVVNKKQTIEDIMEHANNPWNRKPRLYEEEIYKKNHEGRYTWMVPFAVVVGILRGAIPGHDLSWPGTYEAFAHIFVGMLTFAMALSWKWTWKGFLSNYPFWALTFITIVETIFFLRR